MFQQSYFEGDNSSISLIKDRFSVFSSIDDILWLIAILTHPHFASRYSQVVLVFG